MKQDKALLPLNGRTLVEHIALVVAEAAGNATLIGPPERYSHLGYPVVADLHPGLGPLSGIETALSLELAQWNVIVACDLPQVSVQLFTELLRAARLRRSLCILPLSDDGRPQPLAAVWNVRALASVRSALASGIRKVTEAVPKNEVLLWPVPQTSVFENVNTPEEWRAFLDN
jgi:molybdopterin-guanine dinucleotide biosynthesis protein A